MSLNLWLEITSSLNITNSMKYQSELCMNFSISNTEVTKDMTSHLLLKDDRYKLSLTLNDEQQEKKIQFSRHQYK